VEDPLEHEAERVAEQVTRMPDPASPAVAATSRAPSVEASGVPTQSASHVALRRTCSRGGSCDTCKAEQADGEHGKVQRRAAAGKIPAASPDLSTSATTAPPLVHEILRSPGQPLDAATRTLMESLFASDFSRVRIHTDARAAESARAARARAYTVGQHVVFG